MFGRNRSHRSGSKSCMHAQQAIKPMFENLYLDTQEPSMEESRTSSSDVPAKVRLTPLQRIIPSGRMLFTKALPSLLVLLFTLVGQAPSQSVASTNLTTGAPNPIPATTWHPPNTLTLVTLIQKEPFRAMNPSQLFQFMLTARIELQVQAQLAGGMYLPLRQPFEKYGVDFGIFIAPQIPMAATAQEQLFYTDVENAFTAIERQLARIGNGESLIRVLRWGTNSRPLLGIGLVGLQRSVSLAVNGTGLMAEEAANVTAVEGGDGVLATA